MRSLKALALILATALLFSPLIAGAEGQLLTDCRLLVGRPVAATVEKPAVFVIPGTVIMTGEDTRRVSGESVESVIAKLKDAYRLQQLDVSAAKDLPFRPGIIESIESPVKDLEIQVTLVDFDDASAVYRVRLWDRGKVVAEPVVSVKRGQRAIVGGRNGDPVPYFFVVLRPARADEPEPVPGFVPPKLINRVEPKYPNDAAKEGVQGIVELECKITSDGVVHLTRILQSPDQRLSEAAKAAVSQWHYEPARLANGKAVEVIVGLTVRFTLE